MSLEHTNPELLPSWDTQLNYPLSPRDVTAGSDKEVYWRCDLGHSWTAPVSRRVSQKSGCPFCANRRVLTGYNDLATTHPNLVEEWHPTLNAEFLPTNVLAGSNTKVWWRCKRGHEWQTALRNRKLGAGCHYCTGQIHTEGLNDLATLYPEVAKTWHPSLNGTLTPRQVSANSNKYVWWLCEMGHATRTKVNNKTSLGRSCGVCANKTLLLGYNDLAKTHPELVEEWDFEKNSPKSPANVIGMSSNVSYWWKCQIDGYSWEASVDRRGSGTGCPLCANKVIVVGYNDLSTTHPNLAAEFNSQKNRGLRPTEIVAGTAKFFWWKCAEGHEWKTSPNIRWRQGTNCPQCSNRRVSSTNNLEVLFPFLLAEWDYQKNGETSPSTVLPLSALKYWWKCSQGHSWKAEPRRRVAGQGCPTCGKKGFSQAEDGYLYLLMSFDGEMQQFGISNEVGTRLETHKRNGWEVLDVVGPADGVWIRETETALKSYFRNLGLLFPRDHQEKFDGYTETWNSTEKKYSTLASLLEDLRAWEWGAER